jgi:hypothetical protein
MKKSIFIVFTMVIAVMFGSMSIAAAKQPPPIQPPTVTGGIITACMKLVNGQLRIVNAAAQCLPSETAISWNVVGPQGPQGPQGPSGVVATKTISGLVPAVLGSSAAWVFAGPTVSVTTTATQRITGAVQAPLGTASLTDVASFKYDLCYRVAGSSNGLTNFGGANSSIGAVMPNTTDVPFPAIASVMPGAGTWDVGYCLSNLGTVALDNNGIANGWVIVTE